MPMPHRPTPTLLRRTSHATAALLLAVPVLAQRAGAQAPQHVAANDSVDVHRGDTLWGLSATYLGTPWRWPAIRDANTDRVRDPHWIYPGQRLRIPGVNAVRDSAVDVAPEQGSDASSVSWQSTDPAPTRPAVARAATPIVWPGRDSASRLLPYASAPYVAERGELDGAGAVVEDADVGARGERTGRQRFLLQDRVVLTVPRGEEELVRTRGIVVLVRPGPVVHGRVLVIPTAIARVEGLAGDFATARLVRVFDIVQTGDRTVSASSLAFAPSAGSNASTRDTRVEWVSSSAELPSVGHLVVLGTGAADNVGEDDYFELVAPDHHVGSHLVTGAHVAVVRVLRVTPHTATAIVVSQQQPAITVGMTARPFVPSVTPREPGGR
jgi:LysM domain